jgi:hypothetical protein
MSGSSSLNSFSSSSSNNNNRTNCTYRQATTRLSRRVSSHLDSRRSSYCSFCCRTDRPSDRPTYATQRPLKVREQRRETPRNASTNEHPGNKTFDNYSLVRLHDHLAGRERLNGDQLYG